MFLFVTFLKLKCLVRIPGTVSGLVKRLLDGKYVLCWWNGCRGMVER
jgi:hypothetical protein